MIFVLCFISIDRIQQIDRVSIESSRIFPILVFLSETNAQLAKLRMLKHGHLASGKAAEDSKHLHLIENIERSIKSCDSLITQPEERAFWLPVKAGLNDYLKLSSRQFRADSATVKSNGKNYNNGFFTYTTTIERINDLSRYYQLMIEQEVKTSSKRFDDARIAIVFGGLALGIFFIILSWYVWRKTFEHLGELTLSEAKYRAILESSSDANFFLDQNYRLISFNRAAVEKVDRLFKRNLKVGDSFLDLMPIEMRLDFIANFKRALMGNEIVYEHSVTLDRQTRWFKRYYYPVKNNLGDIVGVAINSENITEQKEAEMRINNQNAALSEISHIQSHRVRGPVATLLGLVSLFDPKNQTNEFNVKIIREIKSTTEKLDQVIHEVVEKTYQIDKR